MLDALVRPVISFSLDCELLKKMRRDKVEEIFKPKFFDNASKFTWDNLHIFTSFCFIFIFLLSIFLMDADCHGHTNNSKFHFSCIYTNVLHQLSTLKIPCLDDHRYQILSLDEQRDREESF